MIAAIQGGCVGGGVDLTSACDIRYASADAFFCIQEINIGMTADAGTFPRLCRLIPQGWVRELAYTGRRLPAAPARGIRQGNRGHQPLRVGMLGVVDDAAARADFDDLAALQNDQPVGAAERAQPVSDRDRRPPRDQVLQCGLDVALRFGIHG